LLVGDGPAVDSVIVPEVFFRIIGEYLLYGIWEFDSPCEHQFALCEIGQRLSLAGVHDEKRESFAGSAPARRIFSRSGAYLYHMPLLLKDLIKEYGPSFSLRQTMRLECPLCGHDITGADLAPGTTAHVKLFGAANWSICPHCHQPTGEPNDMEWKVKATTYMYQNRREAFNQLASEWKKQWLKIIFVTDKKLFRQLAKKRNS
jgi:hypothetical protein